MSGNTRRRRLRVFDLATPSFWFVVFYERRRFRAHLYPPPKWTRGWLHVMRREEAPSPDAGFALGEVDPRFGVCGCGTPMDQHGCPHGH